MIGIRSAISIRARGHRPHLEAVYMTAPRSACRNTKKLLPMLRALLISGASAYLRHQRTRGVSDPWLRDLLARRPYKVVMVALAAKTARIIWAMLVKGEPYRDRASAPAAA